MSTADVFDILKQIKELYCSIKQISLLYIDDFHELTLDEFLNDRERLLKEVYQKEAEYTNLKKTDSAATMECSRLKREIGDLIRGIISLDSNITDKIALSMRSIKQELSNLYGTSKAALAYTSQRRL